MVCAAQQAAALPRRTGLNGEELARDWSAPPGVSSQSLSQHVILAKNKKKEKRNFEAMQRMSANVNVMILKWQHYLVILALHEVCVVEKN